MENKLQRDKRSVTMHDVAQHAGVSRATVSRILNNRDTPISISDATRHRVLEAVDELGYRPNRIAQSLMTNKTHIIGLSFPAFYAPSEPRDDWCDIPAYTIGRIISGVQSVTAKRHYDIQLLLRPEHDDSGPPHTNSPLDFVDGVIYVTPDPRYDLYTPIVEAGLPVVMLGPNPGNRPLTTVVGDNTGAIYALTQALIRRGHRRIALLLPGDDTNLLSRLRKQGYMQALEEAGLPQEPDLILPNDQSPFPNHLDQHQAGSVTQHILSLKPAPTAVLVGYSILVYGVLRELRASGVRCPDDLELVSYGDELGFATSAPSVTALDIRLAAQAARAAEMLFEEIEGRCPAGRAIICPPILRYRESCPLNGAFTPPPTWGAFQAYQPARKEVVSAYEKQ